MSSTFTASASQPQLSAHASAAPVSPHSPPRSQRNSLQVVTAAEIQHVWPKKAKQNKGWQGMPRPYMINDQRENDAYYLSYH